MKTSYFLSFAFVVWYQWHNTFSLGGLRNKNNRFSNGENIETITKDVNYPLKITDCITKARIFTITRNWSFWEVFFWQNDWFNGSFEHNFISYLRVVRAQIIKVPTCARVSLCKSRELLLLMKSDVYNSHKTIFSQLTNTQWYNRSAAFL